MARHKGRNRAQQRRTSSSVKGNAASKKERGTKPSNSRTPAKKKVTLGLLKPVIWLLAAVIAIIVPSYILYRIDRPPQGQPTVGTDLFKDISSNFSFGFDQPDISKTITLQNDQAMSIKWSRISEGGLEAWFRLGPYSVQNMPTTARLVAMVPVSAQLVTCTYVDLNTATGSQGVEYAPEQKADCSSASGELAKFYSTSLVPNSDPNGQYYIDLTFGWRDPTITHLGVSRDAVYLSYQGRFSTDPAGPFFPADSVNIHYDTSRSNNPSGLPHGVYLEYEAGPSENITDTAPTPDTTSENTQIWIADAQRPTYFITVLTENSDTRRIFELAQQGIFLIIGGVIGATVPRLRRRKASTELATSL